MLNQIFRRWVMSFCLAASIGILVVDLVGSAQPQQIWLMLSLWPMLGVFGEWQFQLGKQQTQSQ